MDDFGTFLSGLRVQIERCAADAGAARRKRARPRARTTRIAALSAAAGLAAAALVLALVVWSPGHGASPSPSSVGTSAVVLAPLPQSLGTSSPQLRDRGLVQGPVPDPGYHLLDVAARGPNDVWAVGFLTRVTAGSATTSSLVLHWDGSSWRQVRTPEVGAVRAVAVEADGGAWATAWGMGPEARQHMLRWDGQAWSDYMLPARAGLMTDIVAIAPNDVWAVGSKTDPMVTRGKYSWNPEHVRLAHWDGTSWTTVAPPAGARRGFLRSVSATGPQDVWAVGRRDLPGGTAAGPLALHWDGSSWTRVPGVIGGAPWLETVAALSPTDVWTGGEKLLERWDGSDWRVEPHDFSVHGQLSAASPTSLWLATQNRGVVAWDGHSWRSFSLHGMGVKRAGTWPSINAVTALSAQDVWAVGEVHSHRRSSESGPAMPLIVHWDGSRWSIVVDSVSSR